MTNDKRKYGLDILRVLLALLIFMFHSRIHFGCSYGFLDLFVSKGAIAMSGFYILSGFVLSLSYSTSLINDQDLIKDFFLKRFISIFPLYFVIGTLYDIRLLIGNSQNLVDYCLLLPVSLSSLQSVLPNTFTLSHYGGTWFISCLMICYFIFPYIHSLFKRFSQRQTWLLLFVGIFFIFYSQIIITHFSLPSVYSSPFFRLIEFLIGILLSNIKLHLSKINIMGGGGLFIFGTLFIAKKYPGQDYLFYDIVVIPSFSWMILSLYRLTIKNKMTRLVLMHLSQISYSFFLVQFFVWGISRIICHVLNFKSNISHIGVSLLVCYLLSVIAYYFVEKPLKKYFSKFKKYV